MRHTMSMQTAGLYLQDLRKKRGLSVPDVARELETSKSQIDRIEDGTINTRTSLFLAYARLVNADIDYLTSLALDEGVDHLTPASPDETELWRYIRSRNAADRASLVVRIMGFIRLLFPPENRHPVPRDSP